MNKLEHHTQVACVNWFSMQYPKYKDLLFAIPNGAFLHGEKTQRIKQWKKLEAEGAKKGVPDLFLAFPNHRYHGLFIEMKSAKGTLSSDQKHYVQLLSSHGYDVCICKSVDDFMNVINSYLSK